MKPVVKGLLIGCGVLVLGTALSFVACGIWLTSGPESGVKLANQMDSYALEYLDEHGLLEPGEKLLAYYDVTIAMDGTEATMVTDRRVLYHRQGRTQAIALEDVAAIDHRHETLVGDVILVRSVAGTLMQIEIPPLNRGETFLTVLRGAAERAAPAGTVAEP